MQDNLIECLGNQLWRLDNLYWIETKEGAVIRFRLNWAQRELLENLWYRNDILKARQLGISTVTGIFMLDTCLFAPNKRCGITDKNDDEVKAKLRNIKFAYEMLDHVPENPTDWDLALAEIGREKKRQVTITKNNETLLQFNNRSFVKVGSSLRAGTYQIFHISELGYIAAHNAQRAKEIVTGGINSAGKTAYVIKESTHEGGKIGENYRLTKAAMEMQGEKLTSMDFRFFFFPWWKSPEYRLEGVRPSLKPHLTEYFDLLERNNGIVLDDAQKAWYAKQEKTNGFEVRQEYPSTPEEAFEMAIEGAIYGRDMTALRAAGRLMQEFEVDKLAPLYVSWDLGRADNMAMWLIQPIGRVIYVVDHYQANDFDVSHYANIVRMWERSYGPVSRMLLPHDSNQRDFTLVTFRGHLEKAGFTNIKQVKRTPDVWAGIHQVRLMLPRCIFHKRCSAQIKEGNETYASGVECLEFYHTRINGSIDHDVYYSHSADAFRCFAEGEAQGLTEMGDTSMKVKAGTLAKGVKPRGY